MSEKKQTFVYLASPYSDPDPQVRQRQHDAVFAAVRRLQTPETIIFSPIVLFHPYALVDGPDTWADWAEQDRHAILAHDELWIYQIPGWYESVEINTQRMIANEAGKTVRAIMPNHREAEILRGNATDDQSPLPKDDVIRYQSGASRGSDADGTRYDLVTPIGLRRLAERYAMGAKKHGDKNWEAGFPDGVVMNHLLRHINLYRAGDRSDDHLAAAAWGLFALMHFDEAGNA